MAKANWLTLSPMSGTGNATIYNIGSEHTGRLDRTTTVTGKAVGIASEKTYSVVQHAKSEFVAVNDTSYQVAGKGGTVTVTGTSNSRILTVSVDDGGTVGTLTVKDATVTNGQAIPGDPGAAEQYSWKVQIQIAENPTVNQRSLTVKVQGSSASVADEIEVVQAASSFTYEYAPSASVSTIAASGGNSVISAQLKTYRNGSLVSTQTVTPTLTGSETGFSISGATVTAENRGTIVGDARSIVVTCNYITTETGETLSDTVTISQAANSRVIVYGEPTITSFEVADIPASGGSVSSGDVDYSQSRHYYYDSGQTEELSPLTTGGQVTFGDAVLAGSLGTTVKSRAIVGQLTCQVAMNGQTSVEGDASVYQQANFATYGNVTITGGTVSDIPASGGSVSSASGISASQTVSFTSGAKRAGSVNITYSSAVSASSKGTTISNQTTVGTLTATATGEGSKKATKQFTISQAKNVPTALASDASFSYPTGAISAAGGTKSPSLEGAVSIIWSSGSEQSTSVSGSYTGFSLTSSRSYSMVATTGFSINTSTGIITATNRGTTEGAARNCGNVSSTLSWTLTITSTYGGGTLEASDTDTLTTPVSQAANTVTYGNVTLTANNPSTVAATGGTATISASASQTVSFTSGASRAGSVSLSYAQKTAVSGFSLSGNKVTVSANQTTSARSYIVVVKASGEGSKSDSKEVTVSQAAGARSYSDITLNVSYPTIAAKGGTVTPTVKYSQTWGWNGSTTGGGTITSGATVSYSGEDVDTLTGKVVVPTKGTSVSGVTTFTTSEVTVSMNGKTAKKTADIKQAANEATSITYGDVVVNLNSVSDIPASGGSVSSGTVTYSQSRVQNYTSGATSNLSDLTSGGSVSFNTVVASSLGTTLKDRTKVGTLTATVSLNGKSGSDSVDVYQQANEIVSEKINTTYTKLFLEDDTGIQTGVSSVKIPAEGVSYYLSFVVSPQFTSGAINSVPAKGAYPDWEASLLQAFLSATWTPEFFGSEGAESFEGGTDGIYSDYRIVENTGTERQFSATIEFTHISELKAVWELTQDAGAYLNVSPTSLTFTAAGGTKSITIDTNESWTIS